MFEIISPTTTAGEVHPARVVGVQPPPQLPGGDPAVVGPLAVRLVCPAGRRAPERRVAPLRVAPVALRQRGAHPGEAGPAALGRGPGLPELHEEHSSAVAAPRAVAGPRGAGARTRPSRTT